MTATDRLNAMQARCDAATEGPWRESWPGQCCENNYCVEGPRGRPGIHQTDTDLSKRDAEFIAAARTDLPTTIAALRAVFDLDVETVANALAMSLWSHSCAPKGGLAWHAAEAVVGRIQDAITEALT